MSGKLDISEEVESLARMTGVEHNSIVKIVLEPNKVWITRMLQNEEGGFYLVPPEYEEAATEELVFEVYRS